MGDRIVAWPMYAVDPVAVEAFWGRLRRAMRDMGLSGVPEELSQPENLYDHWLSPDLLLSQTCGYPLVTILKERVRYVATPRFRAPGCAGAFYRSALVVRHDAAVSGVGDLRGRRVAFNARDSQSGYNALRALIAPLARRGRFFAAAVETGSHRRSLEAVRAGRADVAAIDCITLAHVSARFPAEVEGLSTLAYTDEAPGLPLVASIATSDDDIAVLRRALALACAADGADAPGTALQLDGIEVLPVQAYAAIGAMRDKAMALGYPEIA